MKKIMLILTILFIKLNTLLAMAPPAKGGGSSQQGGGFSSMLLFILPLFAIWYFLLIRPQQKKEKEKKSMLNELKKGEQIMTIGGIIGTVIQVKDSRVTVKIADKTNIEISKSAVANKISQ